MGGEDTMEEEEVLLLVWYCCWEGGRGALSVPLCFFSASLSLTPSFQLASSIHIEIRS
jgi:hypothetical protein